MFNIFIAETILKQVIETVLQNPSSIFILDMPLQDADGERINTPRNQKLSIIPQSINHSFLT